MARPAAGISAAGYCSSGKNEQERKKPAFALPF
jgi:hypothetical protein